MPRYRFRATAEIRGMTFFVHAKDETEAKLLASRGTYMDYDGDSGTPEEVTIFSDTCQMVPDSDIPI
jgi:hypothetical protein